MFAYMCSCVLMQVVDMRWGVREDASVEHTTTEVCLQEIVNCQQDSAGPCFVVSSSLLLFSFTFLNITMNMYL